jgi:hypothetical protein
MLPELIASNPAIQRSAVVLPQPDGPSRQAMLPFCRLKLTSDNTLWLV